jgi:hypothetical protein
MTRIRATLPQARVLPADARVHIPERAEALFATHRVKAR